MFKFFIVFSLCIFTLAYGNHQYISQPPKGWELIDDPAQLPLKIKAIYIGKGTINKPFTPSINVAYEDTHLPINEYVKLAKSYHEAQSGTYCTLLGTVKANAGTTGHLLQIDRPSQWGSMRFIQAIFVQNGEAYVVTATCLKEEFGTHSQQLLKAMQSFNIPEKTLHQIESFAIP